MPNVDFNKKFRFISDGTWFIEGAECIVEDGDALWLDHADAGSNYNWNYDFLINNQHRISGLFRGPIEGNPDDGELCGLDEFKIVIRSEKE